ncbi:uncharacterized protein LOC111640604 isoform X3 [Centruroides sculpturatus]|uniref:uncharacterized protein LOC111640604 isoform X3 n=2 Tax=Centruroides sculpturatus TaxID=218467 RepID=UPI000C6CAEB5|nr:uncharacterized protein LOC111640604 isoform X3 [Centruroides sculpturatus]
MEEIPQGKDEKESNYGNEQEKGEEKMEVVSYPDEQFLPPTVFRQPPDGDEFPPNYTEPAIIENRLEDSGVFLEDAVKVTNNQYVIYPMDLPDGKLRNSPEEKSLAALDELIHGKNHQVVQETMQITKEKEDDDNNDDDDDDGGGESKEKKNEDGQKAEEKSNEVDEETSIKAEENETSNESNLKMEEINNNVDSGSIPKPNDIYETIKNGHHILSETDDKKQNRMQPEIGNRWKSEENLRVNRISSRYSRNNEAQVSVKDRIAMFSRSEMSLNQTAKASTLKEETAIKESPKIEVKVSNSPIADFNLKECKWHSTGNISSGGGNKEKNEINNNKDITSSLISIPNEIAMEQFKKPDVVSSYPQTQWSRYQRYSYGGYNYPRRLEDCYKRFSSGSLFSPLDKKQSKLKGLVIPEKPATLPTVNKSLPTIVSCSSVLLNKLDVPKPVQNYSNLRTETVLSVDCKETDASGDKKYNFSQIVDVSWKQTNANLPKYSPAFKRKSLQLTRPASTPSISPTPPSSLTSPLSPSPPSSICSSNSSSQKQDVFQLPVEHGDNNSHDNLSSTNSYLSNRYQEVNSGKYLAQPVAITETKTFESSELNGKDIKTRTSKVEEWSVISRWARQSEQDDDSTSSTSQQTEDSRHLADDSMSETNSDSEFRPRFLSHQKTVLRMPSDTTDSVRNFRALAEKWAQRSGDSSDALSPTPLVSPTHTLKKEMGRRGSQDNGTKLPPSLKPRSLETTDVVKLREDKPKLTRPTSLVDNPRCTGGLKKLEYAESCESLTRLTNRSRDYKSRHTGIDTASRSLSVSDIRKTFENATVQQNGFKANGFKKSVQQPEHKRMPVDHSRMSSIDSTCSERSNVSLESSDLTVILKKPHTTGSIGITLAGGIDCEVRDITVHKVISGSLADRDGRLRKGDRILEVNGQQMDGLTHRDAQALLKSPCTEMELVVSRAPDGICRDSSQSLDATVINKNISNSNSQRHLSVELLKEGTGLGFGIEGGKDSPLGDRPLVIKRIFKGGAADREGTLKAGDELISVNGQSLGNMTRTEAWNYMKKLPDGLVTLTVQVS